MRRLSALIAAMLAIILCGSACAESPITHKEQLNQTGMRVGVGTGSVAMLIAEKELPNAEIVYFEDNASAYEAVAQGKIDAYVYDRRQMELALQSGRTGVRLLDENMDEAVRIAVGISPVTKIHDFTARLNAFIAQMKANGTLDDMYERWVLRHDETMPQIDVPQDAPLKLTVGTSGIVPPYSYYVGTQLSGYDIELANRFAAWLGASLTLKVYDYGAIIPAAVTGDVDCIMANLNVTTERAEALSFSDELYTEQVGILVRGNAPASADVRWQDYNGKRLGVLVGPLMEDAAKTYFPDSECLLFNSYPDCITALLTGKIDAYLGDEPGLKSVHAEQPEIDYIHDRITQNNYSFAFRKDDPESAALCQELNDFLARSWADGTMQELDEVWFGVDEERKVVDMSDLTGERGTIRVVTTSTDMPFSYIKDGNNVGYDIDLVVRFCRDRGYALELGDVDFAGRIPAIQSGKYDFTTDMNVTPEREEQVLFSDPTSYGGIVLAVKSEDLAAASVAAPVAGDGAVPSLSDLNGGRCAVQTGTISGEAAQAVLPDIEVGDYNTQADCLAALRTQKADFWATEEPSARYMLIGNDDLRIVGNFDSTSLAAVFPKTDAGQALCDAYSAFVDEMWADGTMDEIDGMWFGTDEDAKTVLDYKALPEPNGTLRMAVDTTLPPFVYVKDNRIVGYDVDIAARFCAANGYRLEVVPMDFGGVLPAVQTGKCDFAACGVTVTEERAEAVLFSAPTYHSGTVAVVSTTAAAGAASRTPQYKSFSDLSGKRVSMLNGAPFEELVRSRVPDVGEFSYYSTMTDLLLALRSEKTDAILMNNAVSQLAVNRNPDMTLFPQSLQDGVFGFAFAKGDPQRDAWQAAFDSIEPEAVQAAWEKWTGADESVKTMPEQDWPGSNGTVKVAACDTLEPMSYAGEGGELKGFDLEVVLMMARELDVHVEFVGMEFSAVLSCVQSGKALLGAGSIIATDERRESVDFIDYQPAAFVLVVRAEAEAEATPGLLDGIKTSFNKTFLREDRWQLFVKGVLTTLEITLLSILFGTLVGFGVFMLCRNGNPVANRVTRFFMWLIQGMPMVVLLMILYYIIFGSVAINGIAVAVIGFTLTFGAAVFGLLKMGVGAVDGWQYEAAYALGYSNRRTFFRVILPQALPHVLPAYKGEIVGLIKATAIVGYIAVQDLTKMGDIVRSRTYEAFFPLIAVTIIYFVLEGLIGFAVSRISINLDPKRRKHEDILKGVKTDD